MQSTKDSKGGKSHPSKSDGAGGKSGGTDEKKKSSAASPTGSAKRGEKKSTP